MGFIEQNPTCSHSNVLNDKNMKTFLVFLVAFASMATTVVAQETETVKATFNEYSEGIYYFTDSDDFTMEFEHISQEVLSQFNLAGEEFKGKLFQITYQADTEEDEEGDSIAVNTITGLKLVE